MSARQPVLQPGTADQGVKCEKLAITVLKEAEINKLARGAIGVARVARARLEGARNAARGHNSNKMKVHQ